MQLLRKDNHRGSCRLWRWEDVVFHLPLPSTQNISGSFLVVSQRNPFQVCPETVFKAPGKEGRGKAGGAKHFFERGIPKQTWIWTLT